MVLVLIMVYLCLLWFAIVGSWLSGRISGSGSAIFGRWQSRDDDTAWIRSSLFFVSSWIFL
jgi:hypothetical protein